jgi:acetyl-CoA acetyltransferase
VCIVGWAHSPFGKLEDPDVESLIARVAGPAIADAGISPHDVDGVFVGQFNGGLSKQEFPSSLPMQDVPALRFKPAVRCENACASGSAAVYAGIDFIRAGRGRTALVVGAEKMHTMPSIEIGNDTSRSTATKATPWRRLRRRIIAMGWTTRMLRCARIWGSNSAGAKARKIHSSRRR